MLDYYMNTVPCSLLCLDLTLNSCLQKYLMYMQTFLIMEDSTISNVQTRYFYKNCPQLGKSIIKIKGVVFL